MSGLGFTNKKFYMIVDTETTINRKVFDFAAIICDRKGKIYQQIAVVINDFKNEELFHNQEGFFSKSNLKARHLKYEKMLESGERQLASVKGVNSWLDKARLQYGENLSITAYNFQFDLNVCQNSGIELLGIKSFCLWGVACKLFASRRNYIKFCIANKYFTEKLNMKTNAEVMSHYISGNDLTEPHTALEDILYHELPILLKAFATRKSFEVEPYSWRKYQLPIMVERLGVKL